MKDLVQATGEPVAADGAVTPALESAVSFDDGECYCLLMALECYVDECDPATVGELEHLDNCHKVRFRLMEWYDARRRKWGTPEVYAAERAKIAKWIAQRIDDRTSASPALTGSLNPSDDLAAIQSREADSYTPETARSPSQES